MSDACEQGLKRGNLFCPSGQIRTIVSGRVLRSEVSCIVGGQVRMGIAILLVRPLDFVKSRILSGNRRHLAVCILFRTSNQARRPAEFKHITKRRKRN